MKDRRVAFIVCAIVGAVIGLSFGFALGNPIGLAGIGAAGGIAFYLAVRGRF